MTVSVEEINAIREDAKVMCPRDLAKKYHRTASTMHNLMRRENIKCSIRSSYRVSEKVLAARKNKAYCQRNIAQTRSDVEDDITIKRLASSENIQMLLRINKDNIVCKPWVDTNGVDTNGVDTSEILEKEFEV